MLCYINAKFPWKALNTVNYLSITDEQQSITKRDSVCLFIFFCGKLEALSNTSIKSHQSVNLSAMPETCPKMTSVNQSVNIRCASHLQKRLEGKLLLLLIKDLVWSLDLRLVVVFFCRSRSSSDKSSWRSKTSVSTGTLSVKCWESCPLTRSRSVIWWTWWQITGVLQLSSEDHLDGLSLKFSSLKRW